MKHIHGETDADGVLLLTIDMVDRSMNVLTPVLWSELDETINRAANDDGIRGVVICSAKPDFLAGADLHHLLARMEAGIDPAAMREEILYCNGVLRRLETLGKPVVAAINGMALGGGYELCLACHYRVMGDTSHGRVGLPEVRVGLLPGGGGTQRLPRLIGIAPALDLLLEGRHLTAPKARELGLVDAVVPAEDVIDAARQWVRRDVARSNAWDRPGYQVPTGKEDACSGLDELRATFSTSVAAKTRDLDPAPEAIVACVFDGTAVNLEEGLKIEAEHFLRLVCGPVARHRTRTGFVNKGALCKLQRRPMGVPQSKVTKLG